MITELKKSNGEVLKILNGYVIGAGSGCFDRAILCKKIIGDLVKECEKKICDMFLSKDVCDVFWEKGWSAFGYYTYNEGKFFLVEEYDFLEIDDFENKYRINNNNSWSFYYDDIFYIKEFGDYSYTIASTDANFDFNVDLSIAGLLTPPPSHFFSYGAFKEDKSHRLAFIKDKDKFYVLDAFFSENGIEDACSIELKPYKKIF